MAASLAAPDPDEPNSGIRLLPWVFDGETLIGPGMKDARRGKPVVGQFRHSIPREAVLLAAAPERSTPEVGHVMPERRERPTICGYRIISEMACNDLLQPVALIWDSLVHSQPQLRLDDSKNDFFAVAGQRAYLDASAQYQLAAKFSTKGRPAKA